MAGYVKLTNCYQDKYKYLIGNIFEVLGSKYSYDGHDCWRVDVGDGKKRLFAKHHCEIISCETMSNVIQFPRR